jgi:predicted GNAT superfamily acetyltransferase
MNQGRADHGADGIDIRVLTAPTELRQAVDVINQVWGSSTPLVGVEVLRAVAHAGGYVAAAFGGEQVVGASFGFLARHEGAPALHSHITGVLAGVRHTGVGRAMKQHQRAWAAAHGLAWVTWTFDPLVRRNAWFNLHGLRARVHRYLVDFYGPLDDAINLRDESDRLLVAWPALGDLPAPAESRAPPLMDVPTPEDIVVLRRTDPEAARAWRFRVRGDLGAALEGGAQVVGFTRTGEYLVQPPSSPG